MCGTIPSSYFRLVSTRVNIGVGLIPCNRIITKKNHTILSYCPDEYDDYFHRWIVELAALLVSKYLFTYNVESYLSRNSLTNNQFVLYITRYYTRYRMPRCKSELQKQIALTSSINYLLSCVPLAALNR